VDLRPGEIGQASSVVQIQVRKDDVPDVLAAEAEPFDLAGSGLGWVQCGPDEVTDRPESPCRVCDVVQAVTGIDQHQAVTGLDEEDVRDNRGSGHTHGAAVEVVHLHGSHLCGERVGGLEVR
jgi:hypothetical protein